MTAVIDVIVEETDVSVVATGVEEAVKVTEVEELLQPLASA